MQTNTSIQTSKVLQAVRLADGWCWFVLREKYWLLVADLL
jgi:hypothetical protein